MKILKFIQKLLFFTILSFCSTFSEAQSITNGLVGWWSFTGNAVDSVKMRNNGKVYGAVLAKDRFDNDSSAYYFDGNGDYIDVGTDSSLRGSSHSVNFWFRYTDTSKTMFFVGCQNGNSGEWGSACIHNVTNGLHTNFGAGSNNHSTGYVSKRRLNDDQWHMFTSSYDKKGNRASMYLDGCYVGSLNYSGSSGGFSSSDSVRYASGEHWIFGAHSQYFSSSTNNGPMYYKGYLDDVRIYNRPLSAVDVKLLVFEGLLCTDTTKITVRDTIYKTIYDTSITNIYDTTFTSIYDTTFTTIFDTTYTTIYDTTFTDIYDTTFTTIYDTSYTTIFDTSYTTIYDTTSTTIYDTSHTTVFDTSYISIFDTTYTNIFDTTFSTIIDTTFTTIYDTTFTTIYDTTFVSVTDTLYVNVKWSGTGTNYNRAKIYPNPTNDKITIDFGDYLKVFGHKIFINDAIGQQVYKGDVTSKLMVIDLNSLGSAGIYELVITDASFNVLSVKKLVLK